MSHSQQLTRLSSSQMIGGGLALSAIGGVVFAMALVASVQEEAGGASGFFTLVSAGASIAGWIMVAVGVTRLAAKADDFYRIYMEKHQQSSPGPTRTATVSRREAASTVDRFLAGP